MTDDVLDALPLSYAGDIATFYVQLDEYVSHQHLDDQLL
jgi:hypothetical protein